MNFKERLKAIRDVFNAGVLPVAAAVPAAAPAAAPAPAASTEYTLADGVTKVSISSLAVGGTITPAPAGEGSIVLQDGTTVTYDAAGVITAVTPKAAAAEVVTEMATPEQMRAYLAQFSDDNTSGMGAPDITKLAVIVKALFEDRFGWELRRAKEEADRASAIEIYKAGFSTTEEAIKGLFDLVSELAEAAGAPTETEREKPWEEMTALEQFRAAKNR